MSEFKRKGQIVPKCFIKSIEKKAQHIIVFGCDVGICMASKTLKALTGGCIFYIPNLTHVLKKKNQVTVKGFSIGKVGVTGYRYGVKS